MDDLRDPRTWLRELATWPDTEITTFEHDGGRTPVMVYLRVFGRVVVVQPIRWHAALRVHHTGATAWADSVCVEIDDALALTHLRAAVFKVAAQASKADV